MQNQSRGLFILWPSHYFSFHALIAYFVDIFFVISLTASQNPSTQVCFPSVFFHGFFLLALFHINRSSWRTNIDADGGYCMTTVPWLMKVANKIRWKLMGVLSILYNPILHIEQSVMYLYKRKHCKPVHNTLPSGLRICLRIERGYQVWTSVAIILEQEQMKVPIKIDKAVWLADVKFTFP